MIFDDRELENRFASGRRVAAILRTLEEDAGAVPIADYIWEVAATAGIARHMRRMTLVGLISVREDAPSDDGGTSSLRAQIVTLRRAEDIAIVRREPADEEAFWELHVGDGDPRPVREADIPAAFALVRAALEATR